MEIVSSKKSRGVTTALSFFLGGFGAHRFYLGKVGTGLLMLVTLGGFGLWSLIDFIMAVSGTMRDKNDLPIRDW